MNEAERVPPAGILGEINVKRRYMFVRGQKRHEINEIFSVVVRTNEIRSY